MVVRSPRKRASRTMKARGPSFETRAPDNASALPGKRTPQDEVQIVAGLSQ